MKEVCAHHMSTDPVLEIALLQRIVVASFFQKPIAKTVDIHSTNLAIVWMRPEVWSMIGEGHHLVCRVRALRILSTSSISHLRSCLLRKGLEVI